MSGLKNSESAKDKGAKEGKAEIEGASGMSDADKPGSRTIKPDDKASEPSALEADKSPRKKEKKSGKKNGSSAAGDISKDRDEESTKGMTDDGKSYPKKERGRESSGLKAGFADDNKQFNYFVDFLDKYKSARHYPINIHERIIIKVRDRNDKPVVNAAVKISADNENIVTGRSYADGTFLFFPSEHANASSYEANISYNQNSKNIQINRTGKREIIVKLDTERQVIKNIPLDVLFIFDTTGSMGEEINRLKKTIEVINLNLSSISSKPKVRFGMVLYKDKGDEYITKVIPLTENLEAFQAELDKVYASGGGDYPEDLQSALYDSMKKINWNKDGIRMSFIITDAPPHLDYGQKYTYVNAANEARQKGIKIFSVGTGGLDINGEYVLRQIAQYTYAKYIFLTYGERGEAAGGREGSVSHHTGANFQTDKLEAIIIRFAKEELINVSDEKITDSDEYFTASKISDEKNEETLQKLFGMAISQLSDYSSIGIEDKTTVSILPVSATDNSLLLNAEYFTEQLSFSMSKNVKFKLVERKDMQKVLKELELQMAGLTDEANAAKVGKFLGAKMLVLGKIYKKNNNYEIFLKLLRVETAEVLSVTKTLIDQNLGLKKKK